MPPVPGNTPIRSPVIDDLTEPLAAALDGVAAACRVTRHVQQELSGIRRHTKDDRSPVTVADYAAQAVIARRLHDAFGTLDLVGEEDADALRSGEAATLRSSVTAAARTVWPGASDEEVLDAIDLGNHDAAAGRYWTLDPIDGTKGFLRGGQYAVSLALIDNGTVVLGVLGCPNLSADVERPFDDPDPDGLLFHATLGGGCYARAPDAGGGPGGAVRASAETDLTRMRVCESVEAAHSRQDESARLVRHLGARGTPARLDSQCKYAVVARGQADAYLRFPTRADYVERIWDHAAGKLVAEEAGAVVTDVRGAALDFSHGAGLEANAGIVCAAPAMHGPIMEAIASLGLGPDT